MIFPLTPKKLEKSDSSYEAVNGLKEALKIAFNEGIIKNIALTGPYGSGKSSILQTLQDDVNEYSYLPISLATLQADDVTVEITPNSKELTPEEKHQESNSKDVGDKNSQNRTNNEENLNRKIEYSIVQQLIYREEQDTVPNSRLRRIRQLSKKQLRIRALLLVLFIISSLILFEPRILKVDSIFNTLNFGVYNKYFDFAAILYLLACAYFAIKHFINLFSNSKLNKLNLKEGVIEVVENNSIFNKHLDEILYFFQMTDYNVVIIEDLDRFGTPNIFLKLRELNFLINESKIVKRHIVFIYAVKDDIFINEERTKFFDYIETVIPVINPSNSKTKLKEFLKVRGCNDNEIEDEDLSEMAFFIQDMRILTEIANEYVQYKNKLLSVEDNNQHLDLTKLLAMIVYKNYYPKDFAQLHRREGRVYNCISKKRELIKLAFKNIETKQENLNSQIEKIKSDCHIKEEELRLLFLNRLKDDICPTLVSIYIVNGYEKLSNIATNNILFDKLLKMNEFDYQYYYHYTNVTQKHDRYSVQEHYANYGFESRINHLKSGLNPLLQKNLALENELIKIKSLKIKSLITLFDLGNTEEYRAFKLEPMMDVFIRRGYIDEEYYDYISYFYKGMISLADRDLILSIKRQVNIEDFDIHIDKIVNFSNELKPYMFEHDSILNVELLDFLSMETTSDNKNRFQLMLSHIAKSDKRTDFLYQYYLNGDSREKVFTQILGAAPMEAWQEYVSLEKEEKKDALLEAWLKYSNIIKEDQEDWLNKNYQYLSNHFSKIGVNRCYEIIQNCLFEKVNAFSSDLLTQVIRKELFELNTDNLCTICNFLNNDTETTSDNLNLTKIEMTGDKNFLKLIKDEIKDVLPILSRTINNESTANILFILNNDNISQELKKEYLKDQENKVPNFEGITSHDLCKLCVEIDLVMSNWDNIIYYFEITENLLSDELIVFIELNKQNLQQIQCNTKATDKLFVALFSTDKISISAYNLCSCFNRHFLGASGLESLDEERLRVLLSKDKLPYNTENTNILCNTPIFVEYLLKYSSKFIQDISNGITINIKTANALLSSLKFNDTEKLNIISNLEFNIIEKSIELSEHVLSIIFRTNKDALDENHILKLVSIIKQEPLKVRFITYYLPKYSGDTNEIDGLIKSLNINKYLELTDKQKKPTFDNNEYNKSLMICLKDIGYISSFTEKDNKIRIHHHKNNN